LDVATFIVFRSFAHKSAAIDPDL